TTAVPSYVWLQKFGGGSAPPEPSYLTGGFLGHAHGPLVIGTGHDDNPATPGFRVKAFDTAEGISAARLQSRRQLLTDLNRSATPLAASASPATLQKFQEQ